MAELLKVEGLKKYFPVTSGLFRHVIGQVKAVDDVDFSIKKGGITGLVGESGSGKSTAARAAIRIVEPTEGTILYNGIDLRTLSKDEMRRLRPEIQMVFQDPYSSLNPRLSIGESIGEALLYHGLVKNMSEQHDQVAQVLHRIGLSSDVMYRYPHQFSGGQQQRICIGRAIALRPKLIFLDEAVSALDVSVQAQILNLLIELKENLNLSYLFISHDLSVVKHICDYVYVMNKGKVVEKGSVEEIFNNPKEPYTQELLRSILPSHPA